MTKKTDFRPERRGWHSFKASRGSRSINSPKSALGALRHRVHVRLGVYLLLANLAVLHSTDSSAQSLNLSQVLSLLENHSPVIAGAQAKRDAAQAALITARAYPNPDMEVGGGAASGIGPGALSGSNEQLYLTQPLDLPFVREARRKVAEAGIDSANLANQAVWVAIRAQTRQAYYEILRRQAELTIAEDNEKLLAQIRDKVRIKVEVGEAPRYEEVKAEAEWLNAVKLRETSSVRVEDAKSALRALFGAALPMDFEPEGELPAIDGALPSLENLREEVLARQPILKQIRAAVDQAEARLRLEEKLRYPQPAIKAGVERDPGLEQWRVGITVPLPLWNQRQGPIGEARSELRQSQAQASQQELTVLRELESAYNRFRIAERQVVTFETGLLRGAEAALKVAEAAYRLGERGILDYLDAQRTYRSVRNDYLNARFDRASAWIDIDRLRASELKDENS